jgi:hypothetical protein
MIEEYGIVDKRDKSRGIARVISGSRIKNSWIVVSFGMVLVRWLLTRILRNRFEVPDGEASQQAQNVRIYSLEVRYLRDNQIEAPIGPQGPATWSEYWVVSHRAQIKHFNSIMVKTGNTINLILGSVDVVIGAREFFCSSCVRWVDGTNPWLGIITRRNLGDS